ncbi:NAD(P)-dependent oxidoreductase [Brucella sp. TWI432]
MSASFKTINAFFSHLITELGEKREVHCVAVAHMVPNTLHFALALNRLVTLSAIFAKPKSVGRPEFSELSETFSMPPLSRDWASDKDAVVQELYKLGLKNKDVVIVDIGGYFSKSIDEVSKAFEGNILGLLEGTENGVIKYEENAPYNTPIVTVARSPLKLPEDHLVASGVVFSIEAVLREQAEILQTRTAAVVGYGRVGRSIAGILRGRGINTVVYDNDPVKLAEAAARGFQANVSLRDAVSHASLVVCATGNKALKLNGFGMLQSGCVVASVTSADDELDLHSLIDGYDRTPMGNLTKYEENNGSGRHFFLVADGNAANFLHGAVIGPAIQLIEGEKLKAIKALIDRRVESGGKKLFELPVEDRREVAKIWIEHFL